MKESPKLITEEDILAASNRMEQYFQYLNAFRAELGKQPTTKSDKSPLIEAQLAASFGVPQDVWIPETDAYMDDIAQLVTIVKNWTTGTISEEAIQSLIFSFDEGYDLDYTYIFLGQPIINLIPEEADRMIIEAGSRQLLEPAEAGI